MNNIEKMRKTMPCYFKDGISFDEFHEIARSAARRIKRVKSINVVGPIVYVKVESQTGYSEWDFSVDFNNWGHIEGRFWWNSDNEDSNIPEHFGMHMSGEINDLLHKRHKQPLDCYEYISRNEQLSSGLEFSYKNIKQMLINGLFNQRQIVIDYDSNMMVGEHICFVISWLKELGFNNVKSFYVEDINSKGDKFNYQVEQIVINGTSFFERGDSFSPNDEVIVTYHKKCKIDVPVFMMFYRRNYKTVLNELEELGFSNLYSRKIKDLTTGIITPDGSVEKVLVEMDGEEIEIDRSESYEFDTPIIVEYHTFK